MQSNYLHHLFGDIYRYALPSAPTPLLLAPHTVRCTYTAANIVAFQNKLIYNLNASTADALLEEEFPDDVTQIRKR